MRATMILALLLSAVAAEAFAQGGPTQSRYVPARPTISPYLYLSRGTVGGVPAYYAWVRPQFELERQMNNVNQQLNFLDRQIMIEQQVNQVQQGQLDKRYQAVGSPSSAATFMNYSHFFPMQNQGIRRGP
jgi:hypothetical protein